MTTQQLGHLGYQTSVVFTILGIYFCLSPYFLPKGLHHQISLLLYDEAYTNDALPALAAFSWTEFSHRVFGAIFLVLGLFQFNKNFRRKNLKLHRVFGVIYFIFCFTAAISGFIFAWFVPFGGFPETIIVGVVALALLYFTVRAWLAIKTRDIATHERFTRYTYALGLGIVTIRLLAYLLLFTSIPDGMVLNITMVAGWGLTLLAAYYYNIKLAQQTHSTSTI